MVSGAPWRCFGLAAATVRLNRIVLVLVPPGGIAQDVFADRFQFVLVSDYMFVVVALPDRCAGGVP